jgi:membrane protein DedA with SNARE-associated domain
MEQHLFDLLARHGVWVLFGAQMFGVVGLPIPDEVLLTLAGGLVHSGSLPASATLAAAISGSIVGMTFSYALGRAGARVRQRLPGIGSGALNRARPLFDRHGKWLLAFGCVIPGIRHVAPIAAGAGLVEFRTFCLYAYPGAALWSSAFVALGYYAGAAHRWEHAALLLRAHFVFVAIALGILVSTYTFAKHGLALRRRPRVD